MPEGWCDDEDRRERTRVPEELVHRTKPEMALEQLDAALADGFDVTCVLADAGYGDSVEFPQGNRGSRPQLRGWRSAPDESVRWQAGVSSYPEAARWGDPSPSPSSRRARRSQGLSSTSRPRPSAASWKRISWRKGTKGPLEAEFLVMRVTPAHRWQNGRQHEQVWVDLRAHARQELGAQVLPLQLARDLLGEAADRDHARALGDRGALPRPEAGDGARPFRRAITPRPTPPHGAHCVGLHLSRTRATSLEG